MTLMPLSVSAGKIPSASAITCPVTPKVLGMEGPVTSASRMPTLNPRFCIWLASKLVTSDLPTPPLPLTTAMTCLMLLWALVGNVEGPCSVRSPHPATPQLEHSCVHSSAMNNLLMRAVFRAAHFSSERMIAYMLIAARQCMRQFFSGCERVVSRFRRFRAGLLHYWI